MNLPELDKRKQQILKATVQRYILSGKPVSSKLIAETCELGVSPATIRNEMAILEKMGLISQPHTSAGRVPTDLAYRYYVDMLTEYPSLPADDSAAIERIFTERSRELEALLREVSLLLSSLTKSAAMVFAPFPPADTVRNIDMIRINGQKVVVIAITAKGEVCKRFIITNQKLRSEVIEKVQRYLNDMLKGKNADAINREAIVRKTSLGKAGKELMEKSLEAIQEYMNTIEEHVFIGGTANIVREMEKTGAEWVQMLLEALEKQYIILNLLKEIINENKLMVRIGEENPIDELRKFAFVGASYSVAPGILGSLGVVGPKYMDYARAIGAVDYLAKTLGKRLMSLKG